MDGIEGGILKAYDCSSWPGFLLVACRQLTVDVVVRARLTGRLLSPEAPYQDLPKGPE